MTVEDDRGQVKVSLGGREVRLLRHALERALFIDTPPEEQEAIMTFATRLLEALPSSPRG